MAWQDTMVPLVRSLIGDYEEPLQYLDNRIEDYIVFAAQLLEGIPFTTDYTISIPCTITPDPTDQSDYAFINLVSMKAACLIHKSELKTYEREGIIIKDGPASIDTKPRLDSSKESLNMCEKAFEKAKADYLLGESVVGRAVMTPITVEFYYGQNDNYCFDGSFGR